MSRRRLNKGDHAEKKAKEELEKRYAYVEKATKSRYNRQDMFGCWDFICIDPDKPEVLFVQVSNNRWTKRDKSYRKKLLDFPKLPYFRKEYWEYVWDEHRWEIKIL